MFARMKIALERAIGKEWPRIERDVARRERIERQHERDVALWGRDEYHRQLDLVLGERDEYLRQRGALFEQLYGGLGRCTFPASRRTFARITA